MMINKNFKIKPAKVEFYEGGSFAKVERANIQGQYWGGQRGTIQTFSRTSRRRLMHFMAKLRQDAPALFITLTYPDILPDEPKRWKRDLKTFAERLKRAYPNAAFVWRLELVSRKSGQNEGKIAPHYHLILYGVPHEKRKELKTFKAWLTRTWHEATNVEDKKHSERGTSCKPIKSYRGVISYSSKYLGKVEQVEGGEVGRHWGAYFRPDLPIAELVQLTITDKQAVRIIRLFRRFSGIRSRAYKSLAIFLDATQWRRNIEQLIKNENI